MAGLGDAAAIANQELLAHEAGRLAGAYEEVADRLRRLALGLLASRSLWQRRVPADPVRAARRARTGASRRADRERAGRRSDGAPRPRARSAACSRRPPASAAPPGADRDEPLPVRRTRRHAALAAAAPPRPVRSAPSAVHTDLFARETEPRRRSTTLSPERPPVTRRSARPRSASSTAFDRRGLDPDTLTFLDARLQSVDRPPGRRAAAAPILPLLASSTAASAVAASGCASSAPRSTRRRTRTTWRRSGRVGAPSRAAGCDGVRPRRASTEIVDAFDPTIARPSIVDRVLAGIGRRRRLGRRRPDRARRADSRARPPRLAVPARQRLGVAAARRRHDPRRQRLGLNTNPAFVDAFLLGLNAQLVAELRFRNYPLIPGWTPVRTFWDRANAATGAADHDIVEIATWPPDTPFGSPAHQTPSASSADLVVLFNTPLFREYPGTLVYLVPAKRNAGGTLDWSAPARLRRAPVPGVPGPDLVRSDLLRLRPRPGPRRRALGGARGDRERAAVLQRGHERRATRRTAPTSPRDTVSAPRRVLIRGDILLGGI